MRISREIIENFMTFKKGVCYTKYKLLKVRRDRKE